MLRTTLTVLLGLLLHAHVFAQTTERIHPRDLGTAELTVVQQLLTTLGYQTGTEDGSWSPETEAAIDSFATQSATRAVRTDANALFAALISAHVLARGSDPGQVKVVRQYIADAVSTGGNWQRTELIRDLFIVLDGKTIANYLQRVTCDIRVISGPRGTVTGFETRCPDDPASR